MSHDTFVICCSIESKLKADRDTVQYTGRRRSSMMNRV
jgi:hypothetical protein